MNKSKKLLAALLLGTLGIGFAGSALAHGPHSRVYFGVNIGPAWGPYWGPRVYPGPVYYPYPAYPTVVVTQPAPPPVYVEQAPQAAAPMQNGYWYYCEGARAYYPYVKECPGGWQQVVPQPAQ